MNVAPNALRRETIATLQEVNTLITNLKLEQGVNAPDNIMASLLLAKAQCLNTLTLLRN